MDWSSGSTVVVSLPPRCFYMHTQMRSGIQAVIEGTSVPGQ